MIKHSFTLLTLEPNFFSFHFGVKSFRYNCSYHIDIFWYIDKGADLRAKLKGHQTEESIKEKINIYIQMFYSNIKYKSFLMSVTSG